MSKTYYQNYFSPVTFSLEFIQHYMQTLHDAIQALSLVLESSRKGLLHWGEHWVRSRKGSVGWQDHTHSTESNKERRTGSEVVMVARVRFRPGCMTLYRWITCEAKLEGQAQRVRISQIQDEAQHNCTQAPVLAPSPFLDFVADLLCLACLAHPSAPGSTLSLQSTPYVLLLDRDFISENIS